MGEFLLVFFMMFILVMICVGIISIPIMIASSRGICGGQRMAIIILSWLGIFFGITWFVALILSLVWNGECVEMGDNLDRLEKLARLYKDKAITKSEYENMKQKLLNN